MKKSDIELYKSLNKNYSEKLSTQEIYENCYNEGIAHSLNEVNCTKAYIKRDISTQEGMSLLLAILGFFLDVFSESLASFMYFIFNTISTIVLDNIINMIITLYILAFVVIIIYFLRALKKQTFLLSILEDVENKLNNDCKTNEPGNTNSTTNCSCGKTLEDGERCYCVRIKEVKNTDL